MNTCTGFAGSCWLTNDNVVRRRCQLTLHDCVRGHRVRTLFRLLDRPNEVVHEVLEIPKGISDTCGAVDLRKRGVEDRYDVFEQFRGGALYRS